VTLVFRDFSGATGPSGRLSHTGTGVIQEFTIFALDDAVFALNVGNVREVLRAASLSAVPERSHLEGLLNLRGDVVPVFDLRSRLGLPARAITASDFLIVIESGSRIAAIRTEQPARLEHADEAETDLSRSSGSASGLIAGTVGLGDQFVSVLDAAAIVAAAAGASKASDCTDEATGPTTTVRV
jgi:purine-binding chemotaxis protein CheW